MEVKNSLTKHLVFGYVLLALVISIVLSIGLFIAFEFAEVSLFEHHIKSDISTFLEQYEINKEVASYPRNNFKLFISNNGEKSSVPDELRNINDETNEIEIDGFDYFLEIRIKGDTKYYFLFDNTVFEEFEVIMLISTFVIILIIISLTALVGMYYSKRITNPVFEIASRIDESRFNNRTSRANNNKQFYELEILSNAINAYQNNMTEILRREREFSTDISHELRNPIMGIRSTAENLQREYSSNDHMISVLSRIISRCDMIDDITGSLFLLARDPSKIMTEFEVVILKDAIQEQINALHPMINLKKITVQIIDNNQIELFTSQAIFNVVVSNILRNSITHSETNDIQIIISNNKLIIEDHGKGFTENINSLNNKNSGIGLGLVNRLCNLLKWELVLKSEIGKGTRALITFQ